MNEIIDQFLFDYSQYNGKSKIGIFQIGLIICLVTIIFIIIYKRYYFKK